MLLKTRSRSRIAKPPKPKFLKRSRKPIQRKSRFKSNADPTKTYHTKRTPEDVTRFAESCRMARLANPTVAEDAFEQILRDMGVGYEREKIFYYAEKSKFIMADFFVQYALSNDRRFVIFELDGGIHTQQRGYDSRRDSFIETLGGCVLRFENKTVLKDQEAVKAKIREVIWNR